MMNWQLQFLCLKVTTPGVAPGAAITVGNHDKLPR